MNGPLILGIETSCDETAVGVVSGHTLLADEVASSVDEHARFGGVVPEVASRAHVEAIVPTIERACEKAKVSLRDLDAIAVTAGPGLIGALLVGTSAASGLAAALEKPLYAVNHLAAHVSVDVLEHGPLPAPAIALLVSGGHTSLLRVDDVTHSITSLGSTVDDAAGEAFDKVARLLGLGFPGGPVIDRVSANGNSEAIEFPRGFSQSKDQADHALDFSFSGLKTAVARYLKDHPETKVADIAASFQEAVADVLVTKALLAARREGIDHLLLGGGVAANSRLRALATERAKQQGVIVRTPSPRLCTDNGAMVAALGSLLVAGAVAPTAPGYAATSHLPVSQIAFT